MTILSSSPSASWLDPVRRAGLIPRIVLNVALSVIVLGAAIYCGVALHLYHAADRDAATRVESNMRVAWHVLTEQGGNFHLSDGNLLVGDVVLNNNFAAVDQVKQLVGGVSTVFMGDQRISTNVLKPDGRRAIGTSLAKSEAYRAIFDRHEGFRGKIDILGEPYMTAYDPILDKQGAVIGALFVGVKEVDFMQAAQSSLRTIAIYTVLVSLLAILVSSFLVRQTISRPLRAAVANLQSLADGDDLVDLPTQVQAAEIEEINRTLSVFRDGIRAKRLLEDQQKSLAAAKEMGIAAQGKLVEDFNQKLGSVVEQVIGSVADLDNNAKSMAANAAETSEQTQIVAAASDRAAETLHMVAAASEQLAASSQEIAMQVGRAGGIAQDAASKAQSTDELVRGLSAAATQIGDVINLINDIASQTNLLALNATIEAARAGDAGKGFAVVAGEVKNLAGQTARATSEISAQIATVQSRTQQAVGAIREIGQTIHELDSISSAIAAAVEEQGAATQEITRNIQSVSGVTAEVADNVNRVCAASKGNHDSAEHVMQSAEQLSGQAEMMRAVTDDFLVRLQSGGASLEWGPAWMTGNAVIDQDHERLVGAVNELSLAMYAGHGKDVLGSVLDKLAQYVIEHFAREEGIWKREGLSSFQEHKAYHETIVNRIHRFREDFRTGKATLTAELLSYSREWLVDHVFNSDKAAAQEILRASSTPSAM